jgi:hypothetical protein
MEKTVVRTGSISYGRPEDVTVVRHARGPPPLPTDSLYNQAARNGTPSTYTVIRRPHIRCALNRRRAQGRLLPTGKTKAEAVASIGARGLQGSLDPQNNYGKLMEG